MCIISTNNTIEEMTMGLFDQLKGMVTGKTRSEIDFEKKLKEIDKDREGDKERRKLEMAYAHSSYKSAFWWYEHMSVKPNTGSKRDIEMLHAKYKCSLERIIEVSYYKGQEIQLNFINLVLPDIDYMARGFKSKDECIELMLHFCGDLYKQHKNNIAVLSSPFLSPAYWSLFNTDGNPIIDGKITVKPDGSLPFNDELNNEYAAWYREFIRLVGKKYELFSVSEMKMPE